MPLLVLATFGVAVEVPEVWLEERLLEASGALEVVEVVGEVRAVLLVPTMEAKLTVAARVTGGGELTGVVPKINSGARADNVLFTAGIELTTAEAAVEPDLLAAVAGPGVAAIVVGTSWLLV